VRLLEEPILVLREIRLHRKQAHTDSPPQSRWSTAPACVFGVEGGEKRRSTDACGRRHVKREEIISRGRYQVEKIINRK